LEIVEDDESVLLKKAKLGEYFRFENFEEQDVFVRVEIRPKYGKCLFRSRELGFASGDFERARMHSEWEDNNGCTTDGKTAELNQLTFDMRYIPPPQYFGEDEIEVVVYKDPRFYLSAEERAELDEMYETADEDYRGTRNNFGLSALTKHSDAETQAKKTAEQKAKEDREA
jgi:hypothetical protein